MTITPLQIPAWQQPRDLDFSPLAQLPQVYRQAQHGAIRRQAFGAPGQDGDLREASMRLLQSGDLQGALTLANIDRLRARLNPMAR